MKTQNHKTTLKFTRSFGIGVTDDFLNGNIPISPTPDELQNGGFGSRASLTSGCGDFAPTETAGR